MMKHIATDKKEYHKNVMSNHWASNLSTICASVSLHILYVCLCVCVTSSIMTGLLCSVIWYNTWLRGRPGPVCVYACACACVCEEGNSFKSTMLWFSQCIKHRFPWEHIFFLFLSIRLSHDKLVWFPFLDLLLTTAVKKKEVGSKQRNNRRQRSLLLEITNDGSHWTQ